MYYLALLILPRLRRCTEDILSTCWSYMHPPLSLSLTHTHAPILSLRHTHAPARMQARTHAHTHTPSRTPFLREVTERSERGSLVWLFDRPFPVWSEKNSTKVAPTRGPLSQPPSLSLSPSSLSSIDGASSFSKEAVSFSSSFFSCGLLPPLVLLLLLLLLFISGDFSFL